MSLAVYLVSKDADLVHHFESQHKAKTFNASSVLGGRGACPLVIIDSDENLAQAIKAIEKTVSVKKKREPFYAIIAGTSDLKKTVSQIDGIAVHLNGNGQPAENGEANGLRGGHKIEEKKSELSLSQLLEKRLSDCVRKMKPGHPRNIYDLLISECERSIFNMAIQESEGNQIRAAEILGINRNTLSKKIKAFKIPVNKRNGKG